MSSGAIQNPNAQPRGPAPRYAPPPEIQNTREPAIIRWFLIAAALVFLALFLVMPLVSVFAEAFASGVGPYLTAIRDPDALSAIRLTLITAAVAVPLNLVFGVVAAWAIAKFDFIGKSVLITFD